ncbi:unnamed protein product [Aureobasidium uvarum]|uniref:Uncharacterized protein n=1 Tax=Aureobasidium uvarum TaxID=2773716 RepID=A0A9N8KQ27_9PEZI|nr:unnamed protein product [Aureobasidium uvarum]
MRITPTTRPPTQKKRKQKKPKHNLMKAAPKQKIREERKYNCRAERKAKTREHIKKIEESRNRLISTYLGKDVSKDFSKLSEESKQNLVRISFEARTQTGESTEKQLKHLKWAATTFSTAALSYYVRVFKIDKRMRKQMNQPEQEEEPVKEELSEAAKIESIETLDQRRRFQVLIQLAEEKKHEDKDARESFNRWSLAQLDGLWGPRFTKVIQNQPYRDQKKKLRALLNRPLSEVPFNATERRLVQELLSLLMRISESIARQPWPERPTTSIDTLNPEQRRASRIFYKTGKVIEQRGEPMSLEDLQVLSPEEKLAVQTFQKEWKEMKQEDNLLDELRKRIEKSWPHGSRGGVERLGIEELIDYVRLIDEKVMGISLLPSTDCIHHIIKISERTWLMESRSSADNGCTMPAELLKEFDDNLYMKDVYDHWRDTNPPDSERLLDFVMED